MCKSVKGAAYFGSSVHVVAAFVFLFWFLFDTVISEMNIQLWKCAPHSQNIPQEHNTLVHYLSLLFKFLYYTSLCTTGIYIFRGVERAAPKMIKFALLAFVIIQTISLALFIAIQLNYWEEASVAESQSHQEFSKLPQRLAMISEGGADEGILSESGGSGYIPQRSTEAEVVESLSKITSGEEEDPTVSTILKAVLSPPTVSTSPVPFLEEEDDLISVLESPLTSTTTTTPMTPEVEVYPGISKKLPEIKVREILRVDPSPRRKLSHNQTVAVVLQIFLVVFNTVGTIIYTSILFVYLMTL